MVALKPVLGLDPRMATIQCNRKYEVWVVGSSVQTGDMVDTCSET
jgi:hypothetical protein